MDVSFRVLTLYSIATDSIAIRFDVKKEGKKQLNIKYDDGRRDNGLPVPSGFEGTSVRLDRDCLIAMLRNFAKAIEQEYRNDEIKS
jgi:hypothetical protein